MAKEKKGMLFFYDWKESFAMLSGEECKQLLFAMLDFSQHDTEPPEFDGMAKLAASFLFPALRRYKTQVESGRKGGESTQKKLRVQHDPSKGAVKGDSRVPEQQNRYKTDTYTNTDTGTDTRQPEPLQIPPPSLEEVKEYCRETKSAVDPVKFFEYYSGTGWMSGNRPLTDWKATLRYWDRQDREKGKHTRPENMPGYTNEPDPLDGVF